MTVVDSAGQHPADAAEIRRLQADLAGLTAHHAETEAYARELLAENMRLSDELTQSREDVAGWKQRWEFQCDLRDDEANGALRLWGQLQRVQPVVDAAKAVVEQWKSEVGDDYESAGQVLGDREFVLFRKVDAYVSDDPSDESTDTGESKCQRCGGPNVLCWSAPSPLWNEVMRGGTINGDEQHGVVCPVCFAALAAEKGIAKHWRFHATDVTVELETVTPSGRVWNPDTWHFEEPVCKLCNGTGAVPELHLGGRRSGKITERACPACSRQPVEDVACRAVHGYTDHGWACCEAAPKSEPRLVAKCGGPALCIKCKVWAHQLHAGCPVRGPMEAAVDL